MVTQVSSSIPVDTPGGPIPALIDRVVNLCVLAGISQDDAVNLIRLAYARADVPTYALEHREENNTDAFIGGEVLSVWHQNVEFLDDDGNPRPLLLSSGDFTRLCEMTSLQSDPNRLLQLLAQAGAIRIEGNRAIAQRRELVMDYAHPAAVNRAIQLSADFASTLHHNLSRDARDPGRFERAVVTTRLSCRHVPSLLAYLRIHGQSFLEDLDEWMAARESVEAGTPIGVGVYLFVGRRPPNG